jgi:hypothetical protein
VARWRGEARRWFSYARKPPEEADTGEALVAEEELSVGYFGFTAAESSRATPSLRRVLSAQGWMPGVS